MWAKAREAGNNAAFKYIYMFLFKMQYDKICD